MNTRLLYETEKFKRSQALKRVDAPRAARNIVPMRRPRLLTLSSAALLLPLLVASVVAGHETVLVCRTGAVMSLDECCPGEHAEAASEVAPPTHASLVDEPCCAVATIELARPVSDRQAEAAPHVTAPHAALLPPAPSDAQAGARVPAIRARRPPSVGPPLVLLKRSFLI